MDKSPIYEAADPIEAGIVVNLLAHHGIAALVLGVPLWGGRGELPTNSWPRIHLHDGQDRPRALALIREYQAEVHHDEDWTCANCGETSGGRFALCWQCGQERPEA